MPDNSTNKNSLIDLLKSLWVNLNDLNRRKVQFLLVLMVISSFAEVLTLASVLPFLTVLANPSSIWENILIKKIFLIFGYQSADELVLPLTILFVITTFIAGFIRLMSYFLNVRVSADIGSYLSIEAYKRTLYQPYSFHFEFSSSSLISSLSRDINEIIYLVINPLLFLVGSLLVSFSIVITLFFINFRSAISTLFIVVFVYSVTTFIVKKSIRSISNKVVLLNRTLVKLMQESLASIRDVILGAKQSYYVENYARIDRKLRRLESFGTFLGAFPRLLVEPIGISLIAIVGYVQLQTSGIDKALPVLGALVIGATRFITVAQRIYEGYSQPSLSKGRLASVIRLIDLPLDNHFLGSIVPYCLKEKIEFRNVNFRYKDHLPKTINNLNFNILVGEKIGVIGKTGSGKSTLIDLIMGLIKPDSGEILIDNTNLYNPSSEEKIKCWQASITHVPQNIYLSDTSIVNNIAFGYLDDEINLDKVYYAAEQSRILDFIENLPEGINTIVGERGSRLSGGQKQRIAIARALYNDASFIVLDEATSALDSKTEDSIMKGLNLIDNSLTMIVVAHRLNSLKFCDRVIEIESGKLIEKTSNL